MQFLGKVQEVTFDGRIIVKGSFAPLIRSRVVDNRNKIAHGEDAPYVVGGRFSVGELDKRINDTETVCTHIITSVTSYAAEANAFQ